MTSSSDDSTAAEPPAGETPVDNDTAIDEDTAEEAALSSDDESETQPIDDAEAEREQASAPPDEEVPD